MTEPVELPEGLELRQVKPEDRRRVQTAVDDWWGRPMGALLPGPFFTCFGDTSFVIERNGDLVAFLVGFLSQSNPDEAYIHAVAVAPDSRGKGLARLLYRRFVGVARRHGRRTVTANTAPINTGSVAFHRRLGFDTVMPNPSGEGGRVELVLGLPPPTSVALDSANAQEAAAALRVLLAGELIRLEPLERRHSDGLAVAARASDWSLMPSDAPSTPSIAASRLA
jgi:GNAT superfamily N-acetyltransferase